MNVMLFLGHFYTRGSGGPGIAPSGISHIAVSIVARGISGTNSSFRVNWSAAGKSWRGTGHWAIIVWSLDSLLIFSNFLRS